MEGIIVLMALGSGVMKGGATGAILCSIGRGICHGIRHNRFSIDKITLGFMQGAFLGSIIGGISSFIWVIDEMNPTKPRK